MSRRRLIYRLLIFCTVRCRLEGLEGSVRSVTAETFRAFQREASDIVLVTMGINEQACHFHFDAEATFSRISV